MKKVFYLTICFVISICILSFAGAWEQDNIGYKYRKDDGNYVINSWEWIDSNSDGTSECFYFNEAGYMLSNGVAPDGYTVNSNGEWVVNGVVQKKSVGLTQSSIYQAQNDNNSFSVNTSGDINTPGNSSQAASKKALDGLKAQCNNLVTKINSASIKDMKLNSWSNDDILLALDSYEDEADDYLTDYELKVDLIIIEYNLPAARKDNLMRDGRNVVSQGRTSLNTKLHQALNKYSDD